MVRLLSCSSVARRIIDSGKPALTDFTVLASEPGAPLAAHGSPAPFSDAALAAAVAGGGLSLMACRPLTGRTHQVRKGRPAAGGGPAPGVAQAAGSGGWKVGAACPGEGALLPVPAPLPWHPPRSRHSCHTPTDPAAPGARGACHPGRRPVWSDGCVQELENTWAAGLLAGAAWSGWWVPPALAPLAVGHLASPRQVLCLGSLPMPRPSPNTACAAGTWIGRHALHAAALHILHPRTGEPLTVRAPLPPDFIAAMQQLGLQPPE